MSNERKLYTGLCNMGIEAINPTAAELTAMGKKGDVEPTYVDTSKDGVPRIRIDFHQKNMDP